MDNRIPVPGTVLVEEELVQFIPVDPSTKEKKNLKPNTNYALTISGETVGLVGNRLLETSTIYFKTGSSLNTEPVKPKPVLPQPGAQEFSVSGVIELLFDGGVALGSHVGTAWSSLSSLFLVQDSKGNLVNTTVSTITSPDSVSRLVQIAPAYGPWLPSELYTVTVDEGLENSYGNATVANSTFTFTTGPAPSTSSTLREVGDNCTNDNQCRTKKCNVDRLCWEAYSVPKGGFCKDNSYCMVASSYASSSSCVKNICK